MVAGITLFVLLGTSLVGYIWDTLNHLLSGVVQPLRLVLVIPAVAILWLVLRGMRRTIESWHARGT